MVRTKSSVSKSKTKVKEDVKTSKVKYRYLVMTSYENAPPTLFERSAFFKKCDDASKYLKTLPKPSDELLRYVIVEMIENQ